jgi:hypothetical protein
MSLIICIAVLLKLRLDFSILRLWADSDFKVLEWVVAVAFNREIEAALNQIFVLDERIFVLDHECGMAVVQVVI